ncbi:unnamed protein product, partial [marine sediment metagenome]
VVILKDETEKKWLPIWVGHYEAKMISLALEKVKPVRPLPHDLIKNILDSLGVVVTRVVICNIKDNTYFASVRLKINQTEKEVDARPSDAIALALRASGKFIVVSYYYTTKNLKRKAKNHNSKLKTFLHGFNVGVGFIRPGLFGNFFSGFDESNPYL